MTLDSMVLSLAQCTVMLSASASLFPWYSIGKKWSVAPESTIASIVFNVVSLLLEGGSGIIVLLVLIELHLPAASLPNCHSIFLG